MGGRETHEILRVSSYILSRVYHVGFLSRPRFFQRIPPNRGDVDWGERWDGSWGFQHYPRGSGNTGPDDEPLADAGSQLGECSDWDTLVGKGHRALWPDGFPCFQPR